MWCFARGNALVEKRSGKNVNYASICFLLVLTPVLTASPFPLDSIFLPQEQLLPHSLPRSGPNYSPENVKPAVLGMVPKETVLLKISFLPKYFQSSWRAVKPQWLSAALPASISPGSPSTALSNWILFEVEGKMLQDTVCRFKNYPPGAEGQRCQGCSAARLQGCVTECHS